MSTLTAAQKKRITTTIRDHHLAFMAEVLGKDSIPAADYARLVAAGKVRPAKALKAMPVDAATAATTFGIITGAMPPGDAEKMAAGPFWEILKEAPPPLTQLEREAAAIARERIGQHITGLGNKLDAATGHILIDADDKARRQKLSTVRDAVASGIENRASAKQIATAIQKATGDVKRNWLQVAQTEVHNAMEEGKAVHLVKTTETGGDTLVFKRPRPDACFPPGVLVTTSRGDVPIEAVAVGDMVLTHKLRWRRVKHHHITPYNDDLVVLDVGATRVPMTRNHPVLSGMNWRDAETLQQGDDVVRLRRTGHSDDEPAVLAQEGVPVAVEFPIVPSAASIDLHRQLLVRDGQIDVEFVDCVLRHETVRSQALMQLLGVIGHHRTRALLGSRLVPESLGLMRAVSSGTRTFSYLLTLLLGHLAVAQRERLTERAELHPGLYEPASDSTAAHAVFGGQGVGMLAALVGADDFLDRKIELDRHQATVYASTQKINAIGFRRYDGVVHNLAVEDDESFFAGGLAVHNCPFCVVLYLQPDKKTPRVFKISELMANGDNVGRKANRPTLVGPRATEWQAVLGAMHPWCGCTLYHMPAGMAFGPTGSMIYVGTKKSVEVESLNKAYLNHTCGPRR